MGNILSCKYKSDFAAILIEERVAFMQSRH